MSPAPTAPAPDHLWYTDDEQACALVAADPMAFVIGFILDQQVTVQKAFAGPLELQRRLGSIDPATLADVDLERLQQVMAEKPAIHRYPSAMAERIRAAAQLVVDEYDGDAARIWHDADDLADLTRRLRAIPGFGANKVATVTSVLVRRFHVPLPEWSPAAPEWGTLGDVDSLDALRTYQARKREYKARKRAAAKTATRR